ncbi:mitochondrial import receptor subunit TOM70-like [Mercenaria mercenaria]|uniref:mitochondrial import receptor subunit TOM70-like n=1 Tax=Mercenaria mercenaria TaxID=6596 RepID=UPI00234EC1FA|nr:mitochondrial import receptor subunit TOM70-like [Mercenaria mercenaria]
MAPIEGRNESSIFEGWEKWQIALAVGAPVCLGLAGLWYYNRVKNSKPSGDDSSKTKPPAKEKVKTSDSSKLTSGSQKENENKDTPLGKAIEFKNSGNKNFKQGKYDEAIKCYTQALEVCPAEHTTEISTFYANRAAAYEKLKNPKLVLENCTEAIKLNGKYTKALSRRANAAEQLGDLQLSLEDVTAVCILEGFQNQSTLQMADRVLKNLGKTKAKEALKNKKTGMPSKHFLKSYFASFTKDPVQEIFKKNKEEKQSNLPEQSDEEVKILNVPDLGGAGDQPGVSVVNGESDSSDSSFRKACEKLEAGEYEEIIPLCRQEISVSPPTHHCQLALLLRGTMFCLTAQSDQAFMDLDQLLNAENLDKKIKVNALIKRGSLFITKEQQTDGLADFAHAVRIDPNNSDIYHHRGHQNIQLDRLEDAIKDFECSISLNPDFPNSYIQKSYAEHRRAAAEQSTGKLEKAIKSYEETLKRFPQNADGHALYAQALCDLGRFDDADNEFETAIKLEPDNANTLVHRALLKLQWKQNIEEPVALIKQAIDLDDKCEYAYEILGTIEVQRGDMVNAVKLFEKAIELCRTETEMSHLFSLLHAAKAQLKAAQTLGIPLPANFSPI